MFGTKILSHLSNFIIISVRKIKFYHNGNPERKGRIHVSADETILTDGKIDPAKFRPIVFDPVNHDYLELGAKAGKAFSEGNKLK